MRTVVLACLAVMAGCASVGTRESAVPPIRLDGLALVDELSDTTREVLSMLQVEGDCTRNAVECARAVLDRPGTVREATRLLAAADLLHQGAQAGVALERLALDCVRHTWRYLHEPNVEGRKSALDARSQLALRLHDACTATLVQRVAQDATHPIGWTWQVDPMRFPRAGVERLVLADTLRTRGLRTRQVDDGIGVAAVAIGESRGAAMFPDQPFALAVNVRYAREADAETLLVTDGASHARVDTALGRVDLARDPSAAYATSAALFEKEVSAWGGLRRPADDIAAGLRLLAPVDAAKVPVVLMHGFASSPMSWANLANELVGDPDIADRYQVWLARYPTAAPTLASRYELERRIDELRALHVAHGGAPALVLVGHSMGGVIARLLASDSGDALWNVAFTRPPGALGVSAEDEALAQDVFRFHAMPGVDTVVFVATPHRGSAVADGFIARVLRGLLAAPPEGVLVLPRIARAQPEAVQPALRDSYAAGGPSSLDTLSPMQPVIRAASELPLAPGVVAYSIIAIADPVHPEEGDGVVPLESARWPGSTELRVQADHSAQDHPATVAELKRILLDRLARKGERPGPRE